MTLFLRFWASVKRLFSSISVGYLSYTCQLGGGSYHYEVLAREKDGATRLMLDGIRPETFEYRLGNRSALEWVTTTSPAALNREAATERSRTKIVYQIGSLIAGSGCHLNQGLGCSRRGTEQPSPGQAMECSDSGTLGPPKTASSCARMGLPLGSRCSPTQLGDLHS